MFRYGLIGFAELLQGRAEMSLSVIQGQVQTYFDPTTDAAVWAAGIRRLGVRPSTPGGGQLLEGINEAAKGLTRREARRPVIVALTTGGGEQSTQNADRILESLRQSRAELHVVFAGSSTPTPLTNVSRPSDLLDGTFNLNVVLGDGPKISGGRRRDVIAMQAVLTTVQQIARDLLSESVVTYTRPAMKNPPWKLAISSARGNVKVIAPTLAPLR